MDRARCAAGLHPMRDSEEREEWAATATRLTQNAASGISIIDALPDFIAMKSPPACGKMRSM